MATVAEIFNEFKHSRVIETVGKYFILKDLDFLNKNLT